MSREFEELPSMPFLDHLEELRTRILRSLMGVAAAYALALLASPAPWSLIVRPFEQAKLLLPGSAVTLAALDPTESFTVIWIQVPTLCAIFLASPWVLYQVWSFIAPGLYRRERSLAASFVLSASGLFVAGGVFAYAVALPSALAFLLSIGAANGVSNVVSVSRYVDIAIGVIAGMGLVFQLPVFIAFLAVLRLVTPGFLLRNARYSLLGIVIVAAVVTPTQDILSLLLVAVPMMVLYFAGVFAAWMVTRGRRAEQGLR
ncbi:MAG: twin-arginine translocase subunit TatC [Bryobacteraceae bacterium]